MRLVSVNIGTPRHIPRSQDASAIDKRPVSGPVVVTAPDPAGAVGLAGDAVGDRRCHGGPDQALYAYAREDLDMWQAELEVPYLRVIQEGEICAGDPVRVLHRPDHQVTIALVFRALTGEPELLPRLLAADALPEEIKSQARRRTAAS